MICSLLMDVSNPGGSTEDVGGVVKEMVSLLTLSEDLGTIFETAVWEPQSTYFLLGPELSLIKAYYHSKRWENIKVLIGPNLMYCIISLTI